MSAAKGAKVFKIKCAACHSVEQGGPNKQGPNLHGIFGRRAGSAEGFKYSAANAESGVIWSDETLFEYLEAPKQFIRGTSKGIPGLKKPGDIRDVIAHLRNATA